MLSVVSRIDMHVLSGSIKVPSSDLDPTVCSTEISIGQSVEDWLLELVPRNMEKCQASIGEGGLTSNLLPRYIAKSLTFDIVVVVDPATSRLRRERKRKPAVDESSRF